MPQLFSLFVKLSGRRCLVVGGGRIAEQKIKGLLASGATVVVVAPAVTKKIAHWHQQSLLTWQARRFLSADLQGVFLVIAATPVDSTKRLVFAEAEARGILCNVVDEPERCHFYYPAVVRRGALQIAISTAGLSPSLARRLRIELEAQFGPEFASWINWLGAARQVVLKRRLPPQRRKRILQRLASRKSFEHFLRAQPPQLGGLT